MKFSDHHFMYKFKTKITDKSSNNILFWYFLFFPEHYNQNYANCDYSQ